MHEITPDHMKLAHVVLYRRGFLENDCRDYEDHYSACLEGLAKAAVNFDAARGISFNTYAYFRMFNEHRDYCRTVDHLSRSDRKRVTAGQREDIGAPIPLPLTDMEALGAGEATGYDDLLTLHAEEDAINRLHSRDQMVWRMRRRGSTQTEIGDVIGVTESRVAQIEGAIRQRLALILYPELVAV